MSRWSAGCASTASTCSITTIATATRWRVRQSRLAARRRRRQAGRAAVALRQLQRLVPAELRRSVLVADDDHAAGEAGEVQELRSGREVGRASRPVADDRGLSAGPHQHAVDRSQRSDAHRPDRQPADERLRARPQRAASRPTWRIAGGYAYQDAFVTSATTAAQRRRAGGPGAAPHALAVEPLSDSIRESAAGLGVLYRSDMFAAIDNTVTLPGYTRADAAVFVTLTKQRAPAGERRECLRQAVLRQRRQQHEHLAGIPADRPGGTDRGVLIVRTIGT